jgi:hypothetical protein
MNVISIDDNLLLSFFLFGLSVCTISISSYTSTSKKRDRANNPQGAYYRLACLLEDVPAYALKGQSYPLASPLLTPVACLLEDAPQTALKGQAYEWATPLMSPLACVLTQVWQEYYRRQLGKPGIHYWEWKDRPECNNICQELSLLLSLTEPKGYAKEVLAALGEKKYPFSLPIQKTKETGNILTSFADSMDGGKFASLDWRVQLSLRQAFKLWHDAARRQIGVKALKTVYLVCYQTSWDKIQQIVNEDRSFIKDFIADESSPWWKVLGVSPAADTLEVEKAYKTLMRLWHPDLNKHPDATQVTCRINIAYECYRVLHPTPPKKQGISSKNNPKLSIKIREWLKPFFSR